MFARLRQLFDRPVTVVNDMPLDGSVNAFALALHRRLRQRRQNLVFSPWSIGTVLQMAALGARGQTLAELRQLTQTAPLEASDAIARRQPPVDLRRQPGCSGVRRDAQARLRRGRTPVRSITTGRRR
jgi:hypothetical protein